MRAITHRGRIAAFAERDELLLAPHIAALETDHPERRWVSCLCIHSCDVDESQARGPYTDEAAAAAARAALMPVADFVRHAERLFDHEVAELFAVPLDQVAARRQELLSQAAGA
jgi:predicted transcriptional regulator